MSGPVPLFVALYGGFLLVWSLVLVAARRRPGRSYLVALGLLEATLVVAAAVDVVRLALGARPAEPVVHLAYVLVAVALLPVLLAVNARSTADRAYPAVLGVGCAVLVVVVLRAAATG